MYRYSLTALALCACLYVHAVHAQDVRPVHPGITDSLPARLRNAIIDSLNKRRQFALPGQLNERLLLVAGNGSLQQLKDTARQGFLHYLQQSNASTQLQKYRKSLDGLKDSAAIARFADNKLRGFYALIPMDARQLPLPRDIRNNFKGASLDASYSDSSGATSGWWNRISIEDQVSLGSIPFNLNYNNLAQNNVISTDINNHHLVKAAFDKEAYVEKLNKQLQSNYDLKKYFVQDIDYRSFATDLAGKRMESLRQQAGSLLNDARNALSAEQLFSLDSLQLKNTLLEGMTEEEMVGNRETLERIGPEALEKDSAARALRDRVNRFDAARKYYDQLMQLKKELGSGQDVLKMVNSQNAAERGVDAYMNNSANAPKLAKQLLPLSFLQKLMLGTKQLNIGNIAANASKGTVSDLFMTGVAGSFLDKNNFVMMGVGKRSDIGMQHTGLNSSISTHAHSIQFMRVGKGDIGKSHTHLTALNANAKNSSRSQFLSGALARNTFVGAVSKQLDLGEWGTLNAELSKSNNRFSNAMGSQADLAGAPKAAIAGFLDDFWTTLSTRLHYSGSIKRLSLSHGAYINYSGLGYTNPGNPYAGRGSLQYGLDVKRSWWKNKASLRFKTDIRNMAQSPVTDNKWKNLQFALDGHYRMSRRMSFDVRLNQASMNEKREGHSMPVFMSRKASVMMQSSGKLGLLPYSGNVMLGLQQMDYMMTTGFVKSTFVNLNLMKSLFINDKSLSWSLMYNKDIRQQAIYGNMLSSDLTYGYILLKKINGSSGLTYLNSENMVRQAGIRQSLSAQVLQRWSLNLFIDARKDLYRGGQYYYYDNFRTEMSIHYLMN